MGRNCSYKSYKCCPKPCYNPCPPLCCPVPCCPPPCCPPPFCCPPPCCPPPCCPPPCGPCEWFAPRYEDSCCKSHDKCGCDSYNNKSTSYFSASSSDQAPNSLLTETLINPIYFNEISDCNSEYSNNSTFIPKCSGNYTFNVSVPLIATGNPTATIQLSLYKGSSVVYNASPITITSGSPATITPTISATLYLKKGEAITVGLTLTNITIGTGTLNYTGARTFSGYGCNTCCC